MAVNMTYNPINRKSKGLIKLFGGLAAPWYYTTTAVAEGTPMKLVNSTAGNMEPCGATEGALCAGLAMQITYNDALTGQMGQLANYHFANDTAQRLNGAPIGLLTGQGWASTTNYLGTAHWGDNAYATASGWIATTGASGAKLPIVFEGDMVTGAAVVSPTPARIRFDFNTAVATV